MKLIWVGLGRATFWIALPMLHFYLKAAPRTRLLLVAEGKVLVVKGWLNDGSWSLPGGGLHHRETPLSGVVRELHEETGITLAETKLTDLGAAWQDQHWLTFRYRRFYAQLATATPPKRQRWELVDATWLPINELSTANAQAHVLDTLAAWQAHR
jgi:8-oxo-dGTP pyrophosphatase MutT (NUDIX family)